jgi:hypothetical protein
VPRKKNFTVEHNRLQADILVALSKQNLGMFWANATGAGTSPSGEWIRYGLIGSSDIIGVLNSGRAIFIEVKTGKATQSPQQLKFEAAIKARNGLYFVARSVQNVLSFVQTATAYTV